MGEKLCESCPLEPLGLYYKVWPEDQLHQHHLGIFFRNVESKPYPRPAESESAL